MFGQKYNALPAPIKQDIQIRINISSLLDLDFNFLLKRYAEAVTGKKEGDPIQLLNEYFKE